MRNLHIALVATLVTVLTGCSHGSSSSPSTPSPAGMLTVTSADLLVGGQSVAGHTMVAGHGEGMPALFEARLVENRFQFRPAPAPGYPMWVEYDRPMGMGPQQGRFRLYDDGTHGDAVAGDGLYCFEDWEGLYACHRAHARRGQYHYEFYGVDHQGRETNRIRVTVRIGSN